MVDTLRATYLIETPLDPARVADTLAGEQSSGTFVRVAGETVALRARSRAVVSSLHELEPLPGTTIELSEVAGPKGKLFKLIREAALGWDGSDPVRPFPDLGTL